MIVIKIINSGWIRLKLLKSIKNLRMFEPITISFNYVLSLRSLIYIHSSLEEVIIIFGSIDIAILYNIYTQISVFIVQVILCKLFNQMRCNYRRCKIQNKN